MAEKLAEENEELVLSTARKRRHVVIDDTIYELLSPEDMELADMLDLEAILDNLILARDKKITKQQAKQVSTDLTAVIPKILLGIPGPVLQSMSYSHKIAIFNAFFSARRKTPAASEPEAAAGSATSPSSEGSTEAV